MEKLKNLVFALMLFVGLIACFLVFSLVNENKDIRRKLFESHYLRKNEFPDKIHSYGDGVNRVGGASSNEAVVEDAAPVSLPMISEINDASEIKSSGPSYTSIYLQNCYSANAFSSLLTLQKQFMSENSNLQKSYATFEEEEHMYLIKKALANGELKHNPKKQSESKSSSGSGGYRNTYSGPNNNDDTTTTVNKAIETFKPLYFIEYSSQSASSSLAFQASSKFATNKSLIHLHIPFNSNVDQANDEQGGDATAISLKSNYFQISSESIQQTDLSSLIIEKPTDESSETLNSRKQGKQKKCIQYVENWNYLLYNEFSLLPFEFEQQVGEFLCRCYLNYLPADFPSENPFFTNWVTTSSLLKNAIQTQEGKCVEDSKRYQSSASNYAISNFKLVFTNSSYYDYYNETTGVSDEPTSTSSSTSSSYSSYSFSSYSSSSTSIKKTENKHAEEILDWELLKSFPLLPASRLSFALKMIYEPQLKRKLTVPSEILNSTNSDTTAATTKTVVDENPSTPATTTTPVTTSTDSLPQALSNVNNNYPSRYAMSVLSSDANNSISSDLISPSSISNGTIELSTAVNSSTTTTGRRLYTYSSTSSYSSSSSSSSSHGEDKDRLGGNSFAFKWKLLPETHQILDLHQSSTLNVGSSASYTDIQEKILHTYNDIIDDDELFMKYFPLKEKKSYSSYYLTDSSRELQKNLFSKEKLIYLKWFQLINNDKKLFTKHLSLPNHHEDDNDHFHIWNDLISSKLIYTIGDKLSLLSLKLSSILSNYHINKQMKKLHQQQPQHSIPIPKEGELLSKETEKKNSFLLLSLLSDSSQALIQYKLTKTMNIFNNLIFQPNWTSLKTFLSLIGIPEKGDLSIIESDLFFRILSLVYERDVTFHHQKQQQHSIPIPKEGELLSKETEKKNSFLLLSLLSDSSQALIQYKLTKTMNIFNNLIFQPNWTSLKTFLSLIGIPEKGDLSIIESDLFFRILSLVYERDVTFHHQKQQDQEEEKKKEELKLECSLDTISELYGTLLAISSISYVRFPAYDQVKDALKVLTPLCYEQFMNDPLFSSIEGISSSTTSKTSIFAREFLLKVLNKLQFNFDIYLDEVLLPSSSNNGARNDDDEVFYRVKIHQRSLTSLPSSSSSSNNNHNHNEGDEVIFFENKLSTNGISLYSISFLNLLPIQKKKILSLLINLPLWNLKEYYLLNNHNQYQNSFHHHVTNYLNLNYLSSWNIYLTIDILLKHWELSIVTITQEKIISDNNNNNNNNQQVTWKSNSLISSLSKSDLMSSFQFHQRKQQSSSSSSSRGSSTTKKNRLSSWKSVIKSNLQNDLLISQKLSEILFSEFQQHEGELANGYFSFLEHYSSYGYLSTFLSLKYPNATIFSLNNHQQQVKIHSKLSSLLSTENNPICLQSSSSGNKNSDGDDDDDDDNNGQLMPTVYRNLYESPELFRFQLIFHNLFEYFITSSSKNSLDEWGEIVGTLLSSALTSFIYIPNVSLISYSMYLLYGMSYFFIDSKNMNFYTLNELNQFKNDLNNHNHDNQKKKVSLENIQSIYVLNKGPYRLMEEMIYSTASGKFINPYEQHSHHNNNNNNNENNHHHEGEQEFMINQYLHSLNYLFAHPQYSFHNFYSEWLLNNARVKKGFTTVLISPLIINDHTHHAPSSRHSGMITQPTFLDFPMIRCDIVNMTRHVHHHYDYAKDGHTRTYTMRIRVNHTETERIRPWIHDPSMAISKVDEKGVHLSLPGPSVTASSSSSSSLIPPPPASLVTNLALGHHPSQHNVVSVHLYRDRDDFPIPYISIYGVTLITALRLGLLTNQREKLFHKFLNLHLYEDMAPWNIVLMGPNVDYIDYDTREYTFDKVIPKAYQVMTVLMNYKRTVEDFKKCGSKANTVYGLPYVSDCVGSNDRSASLSCSNDLSKPVPCPDGSCHSDYISCLRSLADIAEKITVEEKPSLSPNVDNLLKNFASSMTSMVAKFNSTHYNQIKYEDFVNELSSSNSQL